LPELRRQFGDAADTASGDAGAVSGSDGARAEGGGLWGGWVIVEGKEGFFLKKNQKLFLVLTRFRAPIAGGAAGINKSFLFLF
jgi:hypothetical protein